MSPAFPTFFGVPGIEMQKQFDLKKDGFNLYWWRIVEHAGTHLDAPIHFSEAGATADLIGADTLVVPLAVVDVAAKAAQNPDYQVDARGSRRLGDGKWAAARQRVRGDEFGLGAARRRCREVHRQGRGRRVSLPGLCA